VNIQSRKRASSHSKSAVLNLIEPVKDVVAEDSAQKYGDIIEGQVIKVSGTVDRLFDFLGITIYLSNPTIEVVE